MDSVDMFSDENSDQFKKPRLQDMDPAKAKAARHLAKKLKANPVMLQVLKARRLEKLVKKKQVISCLLL